MKPSTARLNGSPLYHFTPFNLEWFAQIVADSQVYFPRPADFNDPFEVSPILDVDLTSIDAATLQRITGKYIDAYRSFGGYSVMGRAMRGYRSEEDTLELKREILTTQSASLALEIHNAGFRVFCLSTELKAVLMWAHYGDAHKGVAFEFARDGDFFGKALRVDYVDTPRLIDARHQEDLDFFRPFLTKATSWSNEREYRLVGADNGNADGVVRTAAGLARFPAPELTAIYVGCKMPDVCVRAILCEVLNCGRAIPVRKMFKVPHTLELSWEDVP